MRYRLVRIIVVILGRLAAWIKRTPWLAFLLLLVALKLISMAIWYLMKIALLLAIFALVVLIVRRMVGGLFQEPPSNAVKLLNA